MNIDNYSSFNKLLRITALLLVFTHKLRQIVTSCDIEIVRAEQLWLHDVQSELKARRDFHVLTQQLDLFVDELGIWRCGGRLENANLPYSTKHPIVLPREHCFTQLVIQRAHQRILHNGLKETLTEVRAKYWVIKGRAVVKRVISKCCICRRFEGPPYKGPPPPPLPSFRVTEQPPFTVTGVDYAGPLFVKPDLPVHAKCDQKVWICLYTCCSLTY